MGNYCKSYGNLSKCYDEESKRVWFKSAQKNQNKIAISQNAFRPTATTVQLGDIHIGTPLSDKVSLPEFIRICSRNRPAGISDSNWETFVLSLSFDCFHNNVQKESDKEAWLEATILNSCGSSIHTAMVMPINDEDSQSLISSLDSTVEFAQHLELPYEGGENDNAELISRGILNTPSKPGSIRTWSSAECIGEVSPWDTPKTKFTSESNLRYTIFSLGELSCNLLEKDLSDSNKKHSSKSSSTETELCASRAEKFDSNVLW